MSKGCYLCHGVRQTCPLSFIHTVPKILLTKGGSPTDETPCGMLVSESHHGEIEGAVSCQLSAVEVAGSGT